MHIGEESSCEMQRGALEGAVTVGICGELTRPIDKRPWSWGGIHENAAWPEGGMRLPRLHNYLVANLALQR
jgi:hypothetical protein